VERQPNGVQPIAVMERHDHAPPIGAGLEPGPNVLAEFGSQPADQIAAAGSGDDRERRPAEPAAEIARAQRPQVADHPDCHVALGSRQHIVRQLASDRRIHVREVAEHGVD
jgi:hypothetical protein